MYQVTNRVTNILLFSGENSMPKTESKTKTKRKRKTSDKLNKSTVNHANDFLFDALDSSPYKGIERQQQERRSIENFKNHLERCRPFLKEWRG